MNIVLTVIRYELGIWKSFFQWVLRRPVAPQGEKPFGYTQAVTPVLWGFIAVSAIEIPVFHLLIPWQTVQGIGLVFGAWGLFWMIGMMASLKIHPHTVGPEGIRVRNGFGTGVLIPWSNVEAVRFKHRNLEKGRTIQSHGDITSLVVFSQTNVDIVLREPMIMRKVSGQTPAFTELRIYADEASAFVASARQFQPVAAA